MERAQRARNVIRNGFGRILEELNQQFDADNPNKDEIQANMTMLQRKVNELKEMDKTIMELMLDSDPNDVTEEALNEESAANDEYQQICEKMQSKVTAFSKSNEVVYYLKEEGPAHTNTRRKFKLPDIELKRFSGDIKDWLHFWGQFKKINEDPDLPDEDKFQYLIQSTVEGSRAREFINSFPPTEMNYAKAVEGLKARFGREDVLVEFYVRELLTVVLKNVVNKNESSLCSLYDKLESQLRALESLGVTSEKYAAMLFPLVESCIPEELLRTWQRTTTTSEDRSITASAESLLITQNRLTKLMSFLRTEVENEERINLATSGFSLNSDQRHRRRKPQMNTDDDIPTATSLVNVKDGKPASIIECIFCSKKHNSAECYTAKSMTLEEKKKIINEKKCCYYCLKGNHFARRCKTFVKCTICDARHVVIMCPKLLTKKETYDASPKNEGIRTTTGLAKYKEKTGTFLQTLVVKLRHKDLERYVRVMIDTGSQKSYILEEVAESLKLPSIGTENLIHVLFGGVQTVKKMHHKFRVCLTTRNEQQVWYLDVLSQPTIVEEVPFIKEGEWTKELQQLNIIMTDMGDVRGPIHILIGADAAGQLLTGRKQQLKCGLVAIETRLGWTLMGQVDTGREVCDAINVISMFAQEAKICELWELESIGIKDPAERKSNYEKNLEVKECFLQSLEVNDEGRYEIRLPWIDGHQDLPSNFKLAQRRLESVIRRLKSDGNYEEYNQILHEWEREGIIEKVPSTELQVGHFLPHRHVIKEGSTTRLRPVFDASACVRNQPSLNDCLETGPNMIEDLPRVLMRFRMNKVGVISDIKRAFLQISVCKEDRDFLKFLWVDKNNEQITYRHTRVVFGVSSSPFLLGAVIDHHLNETLRTEQNQSVKDNIKKLMISLYVDNCVTSVRDEQELIRFIDDSKDVMARAKFDLRGWEYTAERNNENSETALVLGLEWNKQTDNLRVRVDSIKGLKYERVTKRVILSVTQKVFDPIGFLSPIMLSPKLLLQETWADGLDWDAIVDDDVEAKFLKWCEELPILATIEIPRGMLLGRTDKGVKYSIHTFCDASKNAYAAVVFLRIEMPNEVHIRLIQAKARIAPLIKKLTTPRLELMAATVGVRLTHEIMQVLEFSRPVDVTYWSDSTTVLTWIKNNERSTVFIKNRIMEINRLTKWENWKHVPGEENPADLPSRGCSIRKLAERKWWEGPNWLKLPPTEWPGKIDPKNKAADNDTSTIVAPTLNPSSQDKKWYYNYFSSYEKIVRLIAWITRFINNCKSKNKVSGELTVEEIKDAEKRVIKLIQQEWTNDDEKVSTLSALKTINDSDGIIRVATKITLREDNENFKYPILLPDHHEVVKLLIKNRHERMNHSGVQILMNNLREDYWITRGRRAVRRVLKNCFICKRFTVKNLESQPCPLPLDRIREARVFEVVGIDYAGPLYVKGNQKVWICLFTCAVYRAVHMELVSHLSTTSFIQALRRFISRRGRPEKIYSDNGTNFTGAEGLFSLVDWNKISEYATVQRIEWKFNPPTAAWWGGWWERIIRTVKDLLRRVLGRACVTYEELLTILYDCESIINSRPITYMADNDSTVAPLSPNMFLHDLREIGVPDLDEIDNQSSLTKRLRYIQNLRSELRKRFRSEYLGCLVQKPKFVKPDRSAIKVGEIVLIGYDNKKRIDWPIAKVIELIPGKDGECRLVKLLANKRELFRPIQRVFRLEVRADSECSASSSGEAVIPDEDIINEIDSGEITPVTTRRGRAIHKPKRYLD